MGWLQPASAQVGREKMLFSVRMAMAEACASTSNNLNIAAQRYGYTGARNAVGPLAPPKGELKPCPVASACDVAVLRAERGSVLKQIRLAKEDQGETDDERQERSRGEGVCGERVCDAARHHACAKGVARTHLLR